MTFLWWLIVCHTIADWEFQTNWQGITKSKNWWSLTKHVAVYTSVMTAGAYGYCWLETNPITLTQTIWFFLATFWTHFATDAVTSRLTTHYYGHGPIPTTGMLDAGVARVIEMSNADPDAQGEYHDKLSTHLLDGMAKGLPSTRHFRRHRFFATIGYDQLLHFTTLVLTWRWVISY